MTRYKKDLGHRGEVEAIIFLHNKGYQILKQNFHTHWGEIDIIAKKNNKLSFIEVKTRKSLTKGEPFEAVSRNKILKLKRPINYFLLQNNYKDYKLSLDVISVVLNNKFQVERINHFENVNY